MPCVQFLSGHEMSYELFIALRYLRAKRRQMAVSVITAIAITGITVSVAALIVAQALISGFRNDVQEKILQGTDHLNLLKEDNSGIENYRELVERISKVPGVVEASATIYAPVLLNQGGRMEQAVLKGVDTKAAQASSELSSITVEGSSDLLDVKSNDQFSEQKSIDDDQAFDGDELSVDRIVIGQQLAQVLAIKPDDQVTAISVVSRLTPTGLQPRPRYTKFRVVGIFSSGWYQYDAKWAYVSLAAAQRLSGNEANAGVIRMKVADIYNVGEIGRQVRAIAGKGFITTDWQELNRPLFAALQLQHRVIIVFFSLLIMIAALSIVTTLMMMVVEKHRDIAILRAQGATPQSIRRIFLFQGTIIGFVGAGIGFILSLGLIWLANHYRLVAIPAEIYSISHVTMKVNLLDCILVMSLAVAISLLATILPAKTAAQLIPVEALRYD